MTEQDWLSSDDPAAMLGMGTETPGMVHVGAMLVPVSDCKLRLWVAALFDLSSYDYPSIRQIDAYREGIWYEGEEPTDLMDIVDVWVAGAHDNEGDPPMPVRADLLRDVVGNPWRPVVPLWQTCSYCSGRGHVGRAQDECPACFVDGSTEWWGPGKKVTSPWLTATVLSLAEAAYTEREGQRCGKCNNESIWERFEERRENCSACHGTGKTGVGTLDPHRLAVLADALEEAGCPSNRCQFCAGQGEAPELVRPTIGTHRGLPRPSGAMAVCPMCVGGTRPHPLLAHLRSPGPHVRGCFVIDLLLGKD